MALKQAKKQVGLKSSVADNIGIPKFPDTNIAAQIAKPISESIDAFRKISGVPILLNTSFNENEPIVNTPEEALNCFFRTKMDILVIGNFILKR